MHFRGRDIGNWENHARDRLIAERYRCAIIENRLRPNLPKGHCPLEIRFFEKWANMCFLLSIKVVVWGKSHSFQIRHEKSGWCNAYQPDFFVRVRLDKIHSGRGAVQHGSSPPVRIEKSRYNYKYRGVVCSGSGKDVISWPEKLQEFLYLPFCFWCLPETVCRRSPRR